MANTDYGKRYWVIETPRSVSSDGFISAYADNVHVSPSGDLILQNHNYDQDAFSGLILARGQWLNCCAASVIAGSPIVVDRWNTEEKEKQSRWTHPEKVSSKLRYLVLKRDNYTCALCGRSPQKDGVQVHVDHILPKSQGGLSEEENLRTLCADCNIGKSDSL